MTIANKFLNPGLDVWYDPVFRNVLEDHMTYLRDHPTTQYQSVDPNMPIKYRFDMYSLFRQYDVSEHLHWVVMRMNNFNSPMDDISEMESFMVPNETIVGRILQHFQSRNRARGR